MDFVHSLESEWLKKRRSLASWLVVVGAFFTPAIVTGARLLHPGKLAALTARADYWPLLWRSSWESMAIFFLPMGAILATTLLTQIEYKNNAWKQVHVLPLSPATIFFSKFSVIAAMMVQFILFFVVGIYLSGTVPAILTGADLPGPFPVAVFTPQIAFYLVEVLPVVAIQYAICLRFKSFLAPVGIGFLVWVGALAALSSRFNVVLPYSYTMLEYLKDDARSKIAVPTADIHVAALAWSVFALAAGYALFVTKREKG